MRISMTLCRENVGEIGKVSNLAKGYNLALRVEPMILAGKCPATPLEAQELERVKFYVEALRHCGARILYKFDGRGDACPAFAKTYGLPVIGKGCTDREARAYIDAYGNVANCTFLKYPNEVLTCR